MNRPSSCQPEDSSYMTSVSSHFASMSPSETFQGVHIPSLGVIMRTARLPETSHYTRRCICGVNAAVLKKGMLRVDSLPDLTRSEQPRLGPFHDTQGRAANRILSHLVLMLSRSQKKPAGIKCMIS